MVQKVSTKFKVSEVKRSEGANPDNAGVIVTLHPVMSGSPENDSFYKWTPAGQITFDTINLHAAEYFIQGEEYYVDFVKAEK